MAHNNQSFGLTGTVYRKDRSDDTPWLSNSKKKGGASGPSSRDGSRATTPQPPQHRAPAGSFTSDLLSKPKPQPQQGKSSKPSSGSSTPKQPPPSPAVKRLLTLIESLQSLAARLPVPPPTPNPCFCLARTHQLSPYTPICAHCGLILCELQPPANACPSCGEALLTQGQRTALLVRLDEEMSAVLDGEERERQRLDEERRQRALVESGGGAFPTLTGRPAAVPPPPPQERKVLTLGKGRRGPTITTMKAVPKVQEKEREVEEQKEPEVPRIQRPGKQPLPPPSRLKELEGRVWGNAWLREEERPVYVPPPKVVEQRKDGEGEQKKSRRRRRGGGNKDGKENVEGQSPQEGGAGAASTSTSDT